MILLNLTIIFLSISLNLIITLFTSYTLFISPCAFFIIIFTFYNYNHFRYRISCLNRASFNVDWRGERDWRTGTVYRVLRGPYCHQAAFSPLGRPETDPDALFERRQCVEGKDKDAVSVSMRCVKL